MGLSVKQLRLVEHLSSGSRLRIVRSPFTQQPIYAELVYPDGRIGNEQVAWWRIVKFLRTGRAHTDAQDIALATTVVLLNGSA